MERWSTRAVTESRFGAMAGQRGPGSQGQCRSGQAVQALRLLQKRVGAVGGGRALGMRWEQGDGAIDDLPPKPASAAATA